MSFTHLDGLVAVFGALYYSGVRADGGVADHVVKRNIKKRNGLRVPEDRLKSCLPFFGIVLLSMAGPSISASVASRSQRS